MNTRPVVPGKPRRWRPTPLIGGAATVHAGARIAITIDDGPDEDITPRVLDLLDAHGARDLFLH